MRAIILEIAGQNLEDEFLKSDLRRDGCQRVPGIGKGKERGDALKCQEW